MATTTNLGLTLPTVGADDDTWGTIQNTLSSGIDAVFKADGTGTSVGVKVGSGKTLNALDGTVVLGDGGLTIKDTAAPTKIAAFQCSGITAGQTRTYTLPDASLTLAGTVDLGSGALSSQIATIFIGNPAGSYGSVGYNAKPATSVDAWTYGITDTAAWITFPANGINFYRAASGTAGNAITPTLMAQMTATGLNGTVIGATTPAAGTFTTMAATQGSLGPGFAAYNSAGQTLTSGAADAQVVFNTEVYDSGGYFASNTFTPLVAGKYRICASGIISGTTVIDAGLVLYKNGSAVRRFGAGSGTGPTKVFLIGEEVVEFNGSTDNVAIYAFASGTGTLTFQNGVQRGSFSADFVRP